MHELVEIIEVGGLKRQNGTKIKYVEPLIVIRIEQRKIIGGKAGFDVTRTCGCDPLGDKKPLFPSVQ